MNFFCFFKLVIVSFLSLFAISTFGQVTTYSKIETLTSSKIQTYRFPGGICYLTRKISEPDMITYVTTKPELMTIAQIENCLASMEKENWQIISQVFQDPPDLVESLREGKTENMVCLHIGILQTPMLYQVRFAHLSITRKEAELTECISQSAEARNQVKQEEVSGKTLVTL